MAVRPVRCTLQMVDWAGYEQLRVHTQLGKLRCVAACLPAYTSHGPIIQPMLVGQHSMSPGRTSWWKKASAPQRSGVMCDQGMALGSPAPQAMRLQCGTAVVGGAPTAAGITIQSCWVPAQPTGWPATCACT